MRTSRSVRLSQEAAGLVQILPQKITVTKQRAIKEDIHVYAHTNTHVNHFHRDFENILEAAYLKHALSLEPKVHRNLGG